MAMLKVENLSIKYGSIEAVKNVSFEVNEGEVGYEPTPVKEGFK